MPFSIDTGLLRDLALYTTFAVAFAFTLWRFPVADIGRRNAIIAAAGWVAAWSFEYWAFGPAAFIHYYDEADIFVPIWLHQAAQSAGGAFDPAVAGGSDAITLGQAGAEHISLMPALIAAFPLWIAILIHKVLVCAVGMWGAYLLCRRTCDADRLPALFIAFTYTVAHAYVVVSTVHHGIGYAAIPLAIYLLVGRAEERRYYLPVLGLAVALAIHSTPTHSLLALFGGVVLSAFLLGTRRWGRILIGLGTVALVIALNWYDVFYVLASYADVSNRVGAGSREIPITDILDVGVDSVLSKIAWPYLVIGIAAAILLALRGDPMGWRGIAVLFASVIGGAAVNALPWKAVGLDAVGTIRFTNMHFTYPALLLPLLARLSAGAFLTHSPKNARILPRATCAVAVALALASLATFKMFNAVNYLGEGGQTVLNAINNLKHREWAPDEPFRVVTVPYRLPPNAMLAYGLETFDGYLAMHPMPRAVFWKDAIEAGIQAERHATAGPAKYTAGDLYIAPLDADYRCCESVDITRWIDLRFLRLGNVGFIVSRVPLTGSGLRKVSGPPDWDLPRRGLALREKFKDDIAEIFRPADAFVYAIGEPLPQAYFAKRVTTVPRDATHEVFFERLVNEALDGAAAIMPEAADSKGLRLGAAPAGRVDRLSSGGTGYAIEVTAADGGLLVVNTVPVRFWRATVDGAPVQTLAVNGFQVGIPVLPGARQVTLTYERPTLTQRLISALP